MCWGWVWLYRHRGGAEGQRTEAGHHRGVRQICPGRHLIWHHSLQDEGAFPVLPPWVSPCTPVDFLSSGGGQLCSLYECGQSLLCPLFQRPGSAGSSFSEAINKCLEWLQGGSIYSGNFLVILY